LPLTEQSQSDALNIIIIVIVILSSLLYTYINRHYLLTKQQKTVLSSNCEQRTCSISSHN